MGPDVKRKSTKSIPVSQTGCLTATGISIRSAKRGINEPGRQLYTGEQNKTIPLHECFLDFDTVEIVSKEVTVSAALTQHLKNNMKDE